ncbi:stage II sporulation protein P [Halalkalibacter nanhaiisediminis]|uniref:Stage II sporulation protein P n=1 Tax=Halalkalibacter nanhaiisediminis TaxID=688079 RepID=A0A562QK10_9BACI|nr:stage II sporulation protein P [Halalkalibacter nanhaiisediminis]TWI56386.1 stage II sporulation protein P [Halalkalibacter nanhaiisediminis]
MKRNQFHSFTVKINRTSLKKIVALTIVGIIALFVFTGMLTSFEPGYGLASNQVHEWASDIKGEHFVHLLGMENAYFAQVLPKDSEPLSVSNLAFRVATSINPDDPRSLLGRELPGFALFDGRIVVAGEGTDYTNLPVESAPPMEVLMAEREATQESLAMLEQLEREGEKLAGTTDGRKVVHIIHSHNYESFLPELETDVPNEAHHSKINITLVGEKLSQELEKRGIGVEVERRDIQANLSERGWSYPRSYDASREFIKEAMAQENDLEFFFDLHRDSLPRDRTTVTINGEEFARTFFVIGGNHNDHKHNLHLAEELHRLLEENYPGLSRGVIVKEGALTNGRFNQDLSKQSILIEVGGIENSLEETYRSAEALADVFADYYWQADAVSGQEGEEE